MANVSAYSCDKLLKLAFRWNRTFQENRNEKYSSKIWRNPRIRKIPT